MDALDQLFTTFKVSAEVFHNGQYCGTWAIDTSGSHYISFHIVSFGRCYLSVEGEDDQIHTLSKGDIVLFPHDSKHCLTSDDTFSEPTNQRKSIDFSELKEDGTGLVCGYFAHQHPLITSVTEHLPDYVIVRNDDSTPDSLASLLHVLLHESVGQRQGNEVLLSRLAESILVLLFRDHLHMESGILAGLANPKLAASLNAILKSPEHKWTVDALAELSHMSRAAYAELFKQVLGMSPIDYLTQWRFARAYRMLSDEGATTLSAALSCGYDNESSFSKAFKRVLGVTPGAVRAGKG